MGNGVTFKWIAGSISTILVSVGMIWMTSMDSKVELLFKNDFQREGQIASLAQQMSDANRRLGSIESKLDSLLEIKLRR